MKKKYGFGIVGCGVVSKWHINAINLIDDAELIGVFDHNQKSAESFALEHSCKAFSSYEEMLSSDSVDIISICTPSGTHASLSVEAAKIEAAKYLEALEASENNFKYGEKK